MGLVWNEGLGAGGMYVVFNDNNACDCANSFRPNIAVASVLKQLGFSTFDNWLEFSQQLPIIYDDNGTLIDCKTSVTHLPSW